MSAAMLMAVTLSFVGPSVKPTVTSFKYNGDLAPVGYFDPLKLNTDDSFDEERAKWLREAELQHGRLAMLAAVVLPTIELANPNTLSINYLSAMDLSIQTPVWAVMGGFEVFRMLVGWNNPFHPDTKTFTLKNAYQPGNVLSFDSDMIAKDTYDVELSNGRLAMMACAHIIGSELLTGDQLF